MPKHKTDHTGAPIKGLVGTGGELHQIAGGTIRR